MFFRKNKNILLVSILVGVILFISVGVFLFSVWELKIDVNIQTLGTSCDANDACSSGQTCVSYYGIAGPSGPQFKSCEFPCPNGNIDCPSGLTCISIADGPGAVCRQ